MYIFRLLKGVIDARGCGDHLIGWRPEINTIIKIVAVLVNIFVKLRQAVQMHSPVSTHTWCVKFNTMFLWGGNLLWKSHHFKLQPRKLMSPKYFYGRVWFQFHYLVRSTTNQGVHPSIFISLNYEEYRWYGFKSFKISFKP